MLKAALQGNVLVRNLTNPAVQMNEQQSYTSDFASNYENAQGGQQSQATWQGSRNGWQNSQILGQHSP